MSPTYGWIKIAFRKLKASVYFDKTVLPLRDKVVEFESASDFEDKLRNLAQAYDDACFDKTSPIIESILDSIDAMAFPKKTKRKVLNKENNIISVGSPQENFVVSELQYFIDMDVEGHILGVLWIMMFGEKLDCCCYKHAFGHRLRKYLIWDNENEDDRFRDTPALFEPYFVQYSRWRDKALSVAENLLQDGHDGMILTLDLKRFYYNVGLTKKTFNEIIGGENDQAKKSLHSAIFRIIEKYTNAIKERTNEYSENVLPIGFLPSAVLSNWCLYKFDSGILNYWNPVYYGRYADDIIIVEKVEKDSKIYQDSRNNKLSVDYVIDYYLGGKRSCSENSFVDKYIQESSKRTTVYKVNNEYALSPKSNFEFQPDKTRVFALFFDNNSTALLDKFKKQIYENVSEFRLMPEVGEAFSQNDFSQFYHLENDATVNKLCGIKNIEIDKFELSKFLGKYGVISGLIENVENKKFTKIIEKMFNARELIDNYTLWERVFEVFITDKDYDGFCRFAKIIMNVINDIDLNDDIANNRNKVQDSLRRHMMSSINRILSLLCNESKKVIDCQLGTIVSDNKMQKKYMSTQMSNNRIMVVPLESIVKDLPTNVQVDFTDFGSVLKNLPKIVDYNNNKNQILPYIPKEYDTAIIRVLNDINILSRKTNIEYNDIDFFENLNNTDDEKKTCPFKIEKVGNQISTTLKIAVANVSVAGVTDLESLLKGDRPNRKYSRYKDLADIVNAAIKENADMLVFPENYIPFEWLSSLATKAASKGLAIITGIEHIVYAPKEQPHKNKIVCNYTVVILPFKDCNLISTAAMFFQLKKYYSPEEKRLIEGYGYTVPEINIENRPLYRWNDCYFPVYCCYELASINDRAEFMSWADFVVAVEFNKDTHYFSSIVESLTRDLHCYCVQVNTSEFGDSRIIQPTRSEEKNILSVKGGINQTLLIGEINISELREFQMKDYTLQKDGKFKPTPPGFDANIVNKKHGRKNS